MMRGMGSYMPRITDCKVAGLAAGRVLMNSVHRGKYRSRGTSEPKGCY